jgi:hypothetical protein
MWGLVASVGAAALCAGVLFGGCSDDETGPGVGPGGTGSGAGGSSVGGSSTGGSSTGGSGIGGDGASLPTLECGGGFAWDVTAAEDFSLDTKEANQPLPWNKNGAVAASSCGDLGLVYLDSDGGLTYAHFTASGLQGQSSVLAAPVGQAPVIFYDASCAPQIVAIDSGALIQASPSGSDSWQTNPIALTPLTDATVSAIAGLVRGRDGKWHLLLNGMASGTQQVLHGTLDGTSWSFESLPRIDLTGTSNFWTSPRVFNYAVDSQGEVHAAYNNGPDLGYAVTSGGTWQQETVVAAADDRDVPGFDAYIAIDPDDQPAIANGHSTHYSGWSIQTLTLNYLTRDGATWTSELIADEADGYVGGDGNRYTGAQVQLFFDAYGQPYVTFNDLASWHITYNYTAVGQIRYAIKACGQWYYETIFQQDGQTVSPNPIHECLVPTMGLGSDHQTMLFACAERSIPDELASNNNWSSGWGYPTTLRAFLATQQMQ